MHAEEAVRATAEAVVDLPARFMLDGATYEHGGGIGFDGVDFYFAGRGGALGDVHGSVVAAALVFFNPVSVLSSWDRSEPVLPRRRAAEAFVGCLVRWAGEHLADGLDYPRLAELAGRVASGASPAAAPLFAAWRTVPEPEDPKALALHRLNLLRELRGALHGAAVLAVGLEPLQAVMVHTPFMAGVFGWPEPHPDVDQCRPAWEEAESDTHRALARAYQVLDRAELAEFAELATAAKAGAT